MDWCTDESDDLSPEIAGSIACYIDKRMTTRVASKKLKAKLERIKPPSNTKYLRDVKVNAAIYNKLPLLSKKRDGRLRRIHGVLSKGIMAMAM